MVTMNIYLIPKLHSTIMISKVPFFEVYLRNVQLDILRVPVDLEGELFPNVYIYHAPGSHQSLKSSSLVHFFTISVSRTVLTRSHLQHIHGLRRESISIAKRYFEKCLTKRTVSVRLNSHFRYSSNVTLIAEMSFIISRVFGF